MYTSWGGSMSAIDSGRRKILKKSIMAVPVIHMFKVSELHAMVLSGSTAVNIPHINNVKAKDTAEA